MSRPFRVGISGSYGGLNLGDEAILTSIIAQLRATVPVEITVFSRNAEDTKLRHKVERAIQVRDLTRDEVIPEVARLDLFILGGGGILFDGESEIFLRELEIAQERGIATMVYAVGTGPLKNTNVINRIRKVLNNTSVITVREREAKRFLQNLGVKHEILVTADPALLLEPEPFPEENMRQERIEKGRRLIGISVREPGPAAPNIDPSFYHSLIANAADFVIMRLGVEVVFVPMERQDTQHCHAVMSKMLRPDKAWVLKEEYTSGQILSLIKHFEFVIGMRLHFLIFAALQDVPFVALPYSSKVSGFLEYLKIAMPPLNEINAGFTIAYIDKSWDERKLTKEKIQKLLPELKELARQNNKLAVELLTTKPTQNWHNHDEETKEQGA